VWCNDQVRRIVVFLLVACVVVIATTSWWSAETAPPVAAPLPTDGSPEKAQVVEADVARIPDTGSARAVAAQQARNEVDAGAGSSTDTGYTGRVVAPDGTPVAAIEVQLLRVAADAALPFDLDVFAHTPSAPRLVVATALTDAEGRFVLKGIAPRGMCALRLAFADVRAAPPRFRSGQGTFVPVQRTPAPGEVVDLGDVRLKTGASLAGTVVDGDGPVAGARVRAARLPPLPFAAIPIERLRPDGALIVTAGGENGVLLLPEWVGRAIAMLPIAEAFTAADGSFEVHGVDAGAVVVAVTASERASLLRQGVEARAGQTTLLGELFLGDGCSATVHVVDSAGAPIAGAEVLVAPMSAGFPVHIGERGGVTDADGKTTMLGLPRGLALAAARRPGDAAWSVGEAANADGVLRVVVPGRHSLLLTVRDAAGGIPADIRVRAVAGSGKNGAVEIALFGLREPAERTQQIERLDDGRLVLRDLPAGPWCIVVAASGCATESFDLDLRADTERLVSLRQPRVLRVRTVDAAGEPVAEATLYVQPRGGTRQQRIVELPLSAGRTGSDGWCTVRDLPTDSMRLTAMHSLHGQVHALVEGHPAELVMQFAAAASIEGVLTDGGRPPPPGRWVIVLERRQEGGRKGSMPDLPQLAMPGLDGSFVFAALQPGKYRVTAQDSMTDIGTVAGVIQYQARQKQVLPWNKAEVELRGGDVAKVRFDALLDATPYDGPGALVRGTVTIDGAPAVGAIVVGQSKSPERRITSRVVASGEFDLGRCPPGELRVIVVPADVAASRLKDNLFSHHYARNFAVLVEQPLQLDIRITTGGAFGEVRDASGAVVADCRVVLFDRGGQGRSSSLRVQRSDARGVFRFEGVTTGTYELRAEKERTGRTTLRDVLVAEGCPRGPIAVILQPVARVAGRVEATQPGTQAGDAAAVVVRFVPLDRGEERSGFTAADGRFEWNDVVVGRYRVELNRRGGAVHRAGEVAVSAPATLDLVLRLP